MRTRQNKQVNQPDYVDTLENLRDDIFKTMNCVKVGEIVEFNPSRQTVSVQISTKQVVDVAPDGTRRLQDYPLLLECPLVFLSGGESHLTIPPQAGDGCIVLFNDRDLDNWFIEGGIKAPNTYRRHDLSDGIAIVGVRNLQTALDDFLADGVRLQYNSANKIELKDGTIESTTPLLKQIGEQEVTQDALFKQDITVEQTATVQGGLAVGGTVTKWSGSSGAMVFDTDITQQSGRVLKAGNGATGSFTTNDGKTVTVADGIITSIV